MENVIYEIGYADNTFVRTTEQEEACELATKNATYAYVEWQDKKGEWRSMELVPSRMVK